MSRIAKEPVVVPKELEVTLNGQQVTVKSKKGHMTLNVHPKVKVEFTDGVFHVSTRDNSTDANMQSGTVRALLHNMVVGLHQGFEKKLQLKGVGFRAQAKGRVLNLTLGFSHPVNHELPEGIECQTPTQTDIILKGYDKALLGQVAADIRAYREPEPYKGKGIRYDGEVIHLKEAKKK